MNPQIVPVTQCEFSASVQFKLWKVRFEKLLTGLFIRLNIKSSTLISMLLNAVGTWGMYYII